jgi:hypothetical protein
MDLVTVRNMLIDSPIDELDDFVIQCSVFCKFFRERANLGFRRNFPSEQKPEHAFRDDLLSSGSRSQDLLTIWNRMSMESDTLTFSEQILL